MGKEREEGEERWRCARRRARNQLNIGELLGHPIKPQITRHYPLRPPGNHCLWVVLATSSPTHRLRHSTLAHPNDAAEPPSSDFGETNAAQLLFPADVISTEPLHPFYVPSSHDSRPRDDANRNAATYVRLPNLLVSPITKIPQTSQGAVSSSNPATPQPASVGVSLGPMIRY